MPQNVRRRPAGIPEGGQFAGKVLSSAQVSLDPWATDADEEAWLKDIQPVVDDLSVVLKSWTISPIQEGESQQEYIARLKKMVDERYALMEGPKERLENQFGSVDQAVVHVGSAISRQADAVAEIDVELEKEDHTHILAKLREQEKVLAAEHKVKSQAFNERLLKLKPLREEKGEKEYWAAVKNLEKETGTDDRYEELWRLRKRINEMESGTDERSRKIKDDLAGAYLQTLSQVRAIGTLAPQWHPRSDKTARDIFTDATTVFPDDWIYASNTTGTGAPAVRVSKRRAHYHPRRQLKKSGVKVKTMPLTSEEATRDIEQYGRSSDPRSEYVAYSENTRPHWADHDSVEWTEFTVASQYRDGPYDENTPPPGRGWQKWENPDPSHPLSYAWRRPKTQKVYTGDTESFAEITTDSLDLDNIQPVAVHELSHRFEDVVPGIRLAVNPFLERRTTDPETGERNPLFNLYPGSREKEMSRKGGFVCDYIGKEYEGTTHTEVLSVGMESLFTGSNGGLIGMSKDKPDLEHRDLVLGVLATAGR